MPRAAIHIIGGGLAGLAAAVRLAGGDRDIMLYEAARQAGGRCRSYYEAALGLTIDNGNHLLLSGNRAVHGFLKRIGNENALEGRPDARFPFFDLATGESWVLHPNAGPVPWWIFAPKRRVPGTKFSDYLELLKLVMARKGQSLGQVLRCEGLLYERLWRPFFLAVLNTEPPEGAADLAAAVTRETLMKGEAACRPLVALQGLTPAFVDPALRFLAEQNATLYLGQRLRAFSFGDGRVTALEFEDRTVSLAPMDKVILGVPPHVAETLVPGLTVPQNTRAIVNAHFKIKPPASMPPILGVINGLTEWLFAYPDRLSVTISGADRLLEVGREELAERIWADVVKLTHIAAPLPPWQVIKEKRATFAATLEEEGRRPGPCTIYPNLFLAGDWTATGLPATIEGAIRSGNSAADECFRSRRST
jgi:squalene-associated FAD-dependent desaturase